MIEYQQLPLKPLIGLSDLPPSNYVLRFEEVVKDENGSPVKKKYFKTEWLCSVQIHKGNCFVLVKRGRMRADHEHNQIESKEVIIR